MKGVKKVRQLFDEFLESKGVKDEWYRRSEESLKKEFDNIWKDHPRYWIEEGFIWGDKNDSTIPKGRSAREDSLKWVDLNWLWQGVYRNRLWQDIFRSQK